MKKTGVDLITMAIYVVSFIISLVVVRYSWRAAFFGVRLTVARHRAVHSDNVMTRWFGRAGIAYCAHTITYRDRGALKRGGFLAKRVIGAARAACRAEYKLGGVVNLSDMQAEQWVAELTGEVLPRKRYHADVHPQRRNASDTARTQRRGNDRAVNRRDDRSGQRTDRRASWPPATEPAASPTDRPNAEPLQVVVRRGPVSELTALEKDQPGMEEVIPVEPPEFSELPPPEGAPEFLDDLEVHEPIEVLEDLDEGHGSKLAV